MKESPPLPLGNHGHFLIIVWPLQGHINPCRHLASHLTRVAPGARVTFSTAVSGHRRMFHGLPSPDERVRSGRITYAPFSDGYDHGFQKGSHDFTRFMTESRVHGMENLAGLIEAERSAGSPVTTVVYTMMTPWAADVARDARVSAVMYWIQPATVFAAYYHFFHGHDKEIAAHADDPLFAVALPGLPRLQIRDLPSFLIVKNTGSDGDEFVNMALDIFREAFVLLETKGRRPARVLVNTFHELEMEALTIASDVELIPIGPALRFITTEKDSNGGGDLFMHDEEKKYMEWLDTKPEGSVVYVSFGSLRVLPQEQLREIGEALAGGGRPYLWVVRKDNRGDGWEQPEGEGEVVEWCSQTDVLSHPAVGCFVTHCGWSSTLESLACGVPMVGVPLISDQTTIARLVEDVWGAGVRCETDDDGRAAATEIKRCLELVMGEDDERSPAIRRAAAAWKNAAREAMSEGGSSTSNLKYFCGTCHQ